MLPIAILVPDTMRVRGTGEALADAMPPIFEHPKKGGTSDRDTPQEYMYMYLYLPRSSSGACLTRTDPNCDRMRVNWETTLGQTAVQKRKVMRRQDRNNMAIYSPTLMPPSTYLRLQIHAPRHEFDGVEHGECLVCPTWQGLSARNRGWNRGSVDPCVFWRLRSSC